jgi:hypothetical protein
MKYLEQRIEELEKEILKLKAKVVSLECKNDYLYNSKKEDTSHYLNNYPPYPTVDVKKVYPDANKNIWCPPYPEIVGSWDDVSKNSEVPNPDYVDSSDLPVYYPPANPEDVIEGNSMEPTDEYGFKLNYDKMDKDFLEWLNGKNKKLKHFRKRRKQKDA